MKKRQKKAAVNKNMHVGLGRQLKEAEAILAEEDGPIDFSPPCTQEFPRDCSSCHFGCKKVPWL